MFAATGCNPNETWTKTDGTEGPGVSVGTLAYSPDGGMYVCIKADGAIGAGEACYVKNSSWEIDEVASGGSQFETGQTICFPQVALADNEYGWGLVYGEGEFHVAASCAANVALYSSGTAGRMDDASANQHQLPGVFLSTARGTGAGNAPGRSPRCFREASARPMVAAAVSLVNASGEGDTA